MYAEDLSESKYEFLIKKREDVRIKYCNDPNAFIECSNRLNYVYRSIDDYNPSRKRKILIVFDGMITDIMSNKKFQTISSVIYYFISFMNNAKNYLWFSDQDNRHFEIEDITLILHVNVTLIVG